MAILIPQECVNCTAITQDLLSKLHYQLGSQYKIVQHIQLPEALTGSLFWVQYQQQSLFLYFSHAEDFDSNNLKQQVEIVALLKLQQSLLPKPLHIHCAQLVPFLFVHTSISNQALNRTIKSRGFYVLGNEYLDEENLINKINQLLGSSHSKKVHHFIRYVFNPETLIPTDKKFSISKIEKHLLDDDQEMAIKADITLPEMKRRKHNFNLSGLNGGESSGKSEVLLNKAKLIRLFHPEKSILILSINEVVSERLNKRYKKLVPDDDTTEIQTFNSWCKQQLKVSSELVYEEEVIDVIASLITPILKDNGISQAVFLHELDFIFGRSIFYERDYLKAKQRDQPYHLNGSHYSHIWKAVLTLKSELSVRNWKLWSELPQLLWDSLQNNPFIKSYDYILVDDAHDFSPLSFDLIKKAIAPKTGQLFITQDPNQGLINPIQLWKDTGLDLRNHSTRLSNHYGINPCILNAASAFYLNRVPDDMDRHLVRDIDELGQYQIPKLLHFYSSNDEKNRLINEVKNYIHRDCNLEDILIITTSNDVSKDISTLLKETLEVKTEILNRYHHQTRHRQKGIGMCNIMQAQGLEVPYVLVFGLQDIFVEEAKLEKGTKEYGVLLKENTRKISMAMTRARKELTLFLTAENLPDVFITPHIEIPTVKTKKTCANVSYLQKSG